MKSKRKIVFCFPYKGVGGVSLLFLRISEFLVKKYKDRIEVFLVDYIDGYMYKNRNFNLNTKFIEYHDHKDVLIPKNSIVIFQSMTPWSIFPSLVINDNSRIFFWTCHPYNLVPTMPGLRSLMYNSLFGGKVILNTLLYYFKKKMITMISICNENKAIAFMDTTTKTNTENYLGIRITNNLFLPIPVPKSNIRSQNSSKEPKKAIRVAWLGRIVDFKFYVLKHTIITLNEIQKKIGLPIEFTIIGEGPYLEDLILISKKLHNIKLVFIDSIKPNLLDNYLFEEIDIITAMGTSALEGAKLGIPTILLDISYKPVPKTYTFQWIYEKKGYTLGEVITKNHCIDGADSLLYKFQELTENYNGVSEKTLKHFAKNHEISKVSEKMLDYIEHSSLTYNNFAKTGLTKKSIVYNLFRNLKKYFSPAHTN